MKTKCTLHLGLAIALFGSSPFLSGGYQIATIVAAVILTASSLVLYLHDRFSNSLWKRLVQTSASIDVGYTAFGFGLCGAGVNLLRPSLLPFGVILLLSGACLLGICIGKNLERLMRTYEIRNAKIG